MIPRRSLLISLVAPALLLSVPAGAEGAGAEARTSEVAPTEVEQATTASTVRWNPRWQKVAWPHYLFGGAMLGLTFGSLAIPPNEGRWAQVNDFDREIRNAITLTDLDDQNRARDASDVLLLLSVNLMLVDTLLVTWWGHDSGEVAWQMAMIDAETLAFNSGVNGLVTALTSRQRPYGITEPSGRCVGAANAALSDCSGSRRYRAFYSGHTSTTFAIAGLTCTHHAHLPLYGGGAGDAVGCGASFVVAAATGALRVISDQHWASDVLVGAAMGTATGLGVPWLLHYRAGSTSPEADAAHIDFVPTPGGAYLMGVF